MSEFRGRPRARVPRGHADEGERVETRGNVPGVLPERCDLHERRYNRHLGEDGERALLGGRRHRDRLRDPDQDRAGGLLGVLREGGARRQIREAGERSRTIRRLRGRSREMEEQGGEVDRPPGKPEFLAETVRASQAEQREPAAAAGEFEEVVQRDRRVRGRSVPGYRDPGRPGLAVPLRERGGERGRGLLSRRHQSDHHRRAGRRRDRRWPHRPERPLLDENPDLQNPNSTFTRHLHHRLYLGVRAGPRAKIQIKKKAIRHATPSPIFTKKRGLQGAFH